MITAFAQSVPANQQVQSPTGTIQEGTSLAKYASSDLEENRKGRYKVEILPHVKFRGQPWNWHQEDRPGLSPLASASPLQAGLACLHNPQEQVQSHAVFKHAFQVHNPEESRKQEQQVSRGLTVSRDLSPESVNIFLQLSDGGGCDACRRTVRHCCNHVLRSIDPSPVWQADRLAATCIKQKVGAPCSSHQKHSIKN